MLVILCLFCCLFAHVVCFLFQMNFRVTQLTYNVRVPFECVHTVPLPDKSMESRLLLNDIKPDFDPLLQGLGGLLLKSQYMLQLVTERCYFWCLIYWTWMSRNTVVVNLLQQIFLGCVMLHRSNVDWYPHARVVSIQGLTIWYTQWGVHALHIGSGLRLMIIIMID